MGFDEPCFADERRGRWPASPSSRRRAAASTSPTCARTAGASSPIAEAPFAEGGFPTPSGKCRIDAPGLGVPDHVPNYESAASTPELAARFPLAMISPPARNFLNSTFVNVDQPARHRRRAGARDRPRRRRGARHRLRGRWCAIFNDRGEIECRAVVGPRARPGVVNGLGVWWRKLAPDGRNGNELTHQRLTDIGRAPSFYDCLVEVEPATPRTGRGEARLADGKPRPRRPARDDARWPAATVCLTAGCSTLGYYAQSATGHLESRAGGAAGAAVAGRPRDAAARCKARLELSQRIRDFAVAELGEPDNASYRRYADLQRGAAVWNVVAAPELSLELKTWCFAVVGCVGYRGYYDRAEAEAFAAEPAGAGEARRLRLSGAGVFDARASCRRRLAGRPAAQHLHRLSRRRAGPADLPRARAPGRVRAGRHAVQRILRQRGREDRRRALARPAGERPGARSTTPAARRAAPTSARSPRAIATSSRRCTRATRPRPPGARARRR